MTDVTLLQKKINRGKEAEALMDNALFKEMGEALRRDCFKAFKGDDENKAMEARVQIRALEAFLGKFDRIRKDGLSAFKQIQDIQRREKEGLSIETNDMQGIA